MSDSLSDEGRREAEAIGRRHDVPADAVDTVLTAIRRGGGRQAQFSHPALGGMGQWSRGGGIMIGDMFNHALKAKVEQLCNELAGLVEDHSLVRVDASESTGDWWPRELGQVSSTGRQNDQSYACFPDSRRLAIRSANGLELYDTGDHRISGVSQQQGGNHDLSFISHLGSVRLHDLARVDDNTFQGRRDGDGREVRSSSGSSQPSLQPQGGPQDPLATLERLHELQRKGVLTEADYAEKKKELLTRI